MQNSNENKIDYIEIPVNDIEESKSFFKAIFGWDFKDYNPHYTVFQGAGISGGLTVGSAGFNTTKGAPLIVFYRHDLEKTMAEVTQAGGKITTFPFSFPGGRRFHFTDINDNEFAIWSED